jgi:hypothetical protein
MRKLLLLLLCGKIPSCTRFDAAAVVCAQLFPFVTHNELLLALA